MSSSPRVWLIGANSFTGSYLLLGLEKANYNVDTFDVDITDAQQVELAMLRIQPDYIISLAAISFVPDGENESIYAVNTFGPQNILSACLKLSTVPRHIILASSANIYGVQQQEKINEACQPNPINHYGCSKWSMEQIAQTYSEHLNITITRPFNYTGKGQATKFLVPKIVDHFKQKATTLKLGNIDVWRDFSDVRWVAQAYVKLLAAPNQGVNIVNLCSGKLTSIRDIIELLEQITGHSLTIETDSAFVRPSDIKRQCGNNTKLYNTTSNLTQPIDIKETLKWMLQDK
jgi:nucleoside-diphosphate-sugar epimerase